MKEGGDYLIKASQAVAKANTIAYLSELMHPAGIFVRLTRLNPMRQSFRYLLLGRRRDGTYGLLHPAALLGSDAHTRGSSLYLPDE